MFPFENSRLVDAKLLCHLRLRHAGKQRQKALVDGVAIQWTREGVFGVAVALRLHAVDQPIPTDSLFIHKGFEAQPGYGVLFGSPLKHCTVVHSNRSRQLCNGVGGVTRSKSFENTLLVEHENLFLKCGGLGIDNPKSTCMMEPYGLADCRPQRHHAKSTPQSPDCGCTRLPGKAINGLAGRVAVYCRFSCEGKTERIIIFALSATGNSNGWEGISEELLR